MLLAESLSELKQSAQGLSLLYVDNNAVLREKVKTLLKKFFLEVVFAADGEEGNKLFKEHRPQIVITDIPLPKLNGLDMIKRIKKLDPSTKFIIASAFDEKEYLMTAIKVGVFDYLKKPVKVDILVDTLLKCIQTINTEEPG